MNDGSVEVLVQGTRAQIEEMRAWCRRGPPGANVSEVIEARAMSEITEFNYPDFRSMRHIGP